MKIKYLLFLIILPVILLGAGCQNKSLSLQTDQQKQIEELTKKVDELSRATIATATSTETKTEIKQIKTAVIENKPAQKLNISGSSKIDYTKFISYIVQIKCSKGSGSGTIVSPYTVLTNYHVIEGDTECSIGFTQDVSKAPSTWIYGAVNKADKTLDRAILVIDKAKIESLKEVLTPREMDDTRSLFNKTIKKCNANDTQITDELVVMGYPGIGGDTITITNGNIAGFSEPYIKTSAKTNYGNSGGAAIHKSGCFLGIPTMVSATKLDSLGYILDERIGGFNSEKNTYVSGKKYEEEQNTLAAQRAEYQIFIDLTDKISGTIKVLDSSITKILDYRIKYDDYKTAFSYVTFSQKLIETTQTTINKLNTLSFTDKAGGVKDNFKLALQFYNEKLNYAVKINDGYLQLNKTAFGNLLNAYYDAGDATHKYEDAAKESLNLLNADAVALGLVE